MRRVKSGPGEMTGDVARVLRGNLGAHALPIDFGPNKGRYHLVGSVSARALYERVDGTPLTDEDIRDLRQVGPGFMKSRVRSRHYATADEALAAAAAEAEASK